MYTFKNLENRGLFPSSSCPRLPLCVSLLPAGRPLGHLGLPKALHEPRALKGFWGDWTLLMQSSPLCRPPDSQVPARIDPAQRPRSILGSPAAEARDR